MKMNLELSLVIFLSLASIVCANYARYMDHFALQKLHKRSPEERSLVSAEQLDKFTDPEKAKDKVEFGFTVIQGAANLAKIDYKKSSAGEIAFAVAEAVVPIIAGALAFIPVVGPMVSALFFGIWSLISPFIAPEKEDPMQKMIKELATQLRSEVDTKLGSIINRGIMGEIARNKFICNKYSFISQTHSEDFKANIVLNVTEQLAVQIYLNDCDNFLKDTAEAFNYKEYADVLWAPSAMTTFTRMGFLAEVIKNYRLTGLQRPIVPIYIEEIATDTERQFDLFYRGMKLIHSRFDASKYDKTNYMKKVSLSEKATCSLQAQLLYFDRKLYPYGSPSVINNTDFFGSVQMEDYYDFMKYTSSDVDANLKRSHIQIFFNVTESKLQSELPKQESGKPYRTMEFLNCFLGPTHLRVPETTWLNFTAIPTAWAYSYEFRLMYLETNFYVYGEVSWDFGIPVLQHITDTNAVQFKVYDDYLRKKGMVFEKWEKPTFLSIDHVFDYYSREMNTRTLRDEPAWTYWKKCPYDNDVDTVICDKFNNMFQGRFLLRSVGTFNHNAEGMNFLLAVNTPLARVRKGDKYEKPRPNGFNIGVEIILRPTIKPKYR